MTNTESNRQCRETDNTGGRRQTRNQIDNPEKLTTQVNEDKRQSTGNIEDSQDEEKQNENPEKLAT